MSEPDQHYELLMTLPLYDSHLVNSGCINLCHTQSIIITSICLRMPKHAGLRENKEYKDVSVDSTCFISLTALLAAAVNVFSSDQ